MKRTIMSLAATAAILGAVGASAANEISPSLIRQASKAATKALNAFSDHRQDLALRYAERAVLYNPSSADHRALLGQAYLRNGRFLSAETAFGDALRLDPAHSQATLGLALAKIALGRAEEARDVLQAARDRIPATDLGLALALAGEQQEALAVLEPAARATGSNAKARQNLALVYALSGRWAEARATAAIDLGADQVDKRMIEWAGFARPRGSADQVAGLLGVKPAADSGMPAELALIEAQPQAAQQAAYAAAEPASVLAPGATTPESEPAPVLQPAEALPVAQSAGDEPYYMMAGVQVPQAEPKAQAEQPARAIEAAPAPRIMAVSAAPVRGNFVVQLGAFSSDTRMENAWSRAVHKARILRGYTPVSTTFAALDNRTLHRLAISGFQSRAAAVDVCRKIQAQGGECFVRGNAGDTPVQWVRRTNSERLAVR